jgi:hypothetical protein
VSATIDPVIKALLRGAEKSVEMLLDGTFTVIIEKLVEGYIKCMDLETQKKWLQEEGKRFPVFLVGEAEGSRGKRGKRGR